MKKVLIALDYSPSAEKVAASGYAIAQLMKAEVTIVHVIAEPAYYNIEKIPFMGYYHGYDTSSAALIKDIKKEVEGFLAASVEHLGDSTIKTRVLEGEPANSILKFSEDCHADLIVMGSHRQHGHNRLLVTYVTSHVLTHSRIPLITVPTEDKYRCN
jgi:nucleotide-binding universal stress UspA family protein